jgi:hypothetical protein
MKPVCSKCCHLKYSQVSTLFLELDLRKEAIHLTSTSQSRTILSLCFLFCSFFRREKKEVAAQTPYVAKQEFSGFKEGQTIHISIKKKDKDPSASTTSASPAGTLLVHVSIHFNLCYFIQSAHMQEVLSRASVPLLD